MLVRAVRIVLVTTGLPLCHRRARSKAGRWGSAHNSRQVSHQPLQLSVNGRHHRATPLVKETRSQRCELEREVERGSHPWFAGGRVRSCPAEQASRPAHALWCACPGPKAPLGRILRRLTQLSRRGAHQSEQRMRYRAHRARWCCRGTGRWLRPADQHENRICLNWGSQRGAMADAFHIGWARCRGTKTSEQPARPEPLGEALRAPGCGARCLGRGPQLVCRRPSG